LLCGKPHDTVYNFHRWERKRVWINRLPVTEGCYPGVYADNNLYGVTDGNGSQQNPRPAAKAAPDLITDA
jgi:hypothetical protein